MNQQITITEFAKIKYLPTDGLWSIETPYTSDQTRIGYSDAHSGSRSSKAKTRTRTFLSREGAEKFVASAYSKREKAGTLPAKTACTFKGQPAWLMPAVGGSRDCYSQDGEWLSYLMLVGPDANDPNFKISD